MKSGRSKLVQAKHISDLQVCRAYAASEAFTLATWPAGHAGADLPEGLQVWPCELLERETGAPRRVAHAAMERAARRGLIEYGVSLRAGWLTAAGRELLDQAVDTLERASSS